jgi:hypothetical protein
LLPRIPGNVEGGVLTAGGLPYRVVIIHQGEGNAPVVGEFAAGRKTNFATAVNSTAFNINVIVVFDQDGGIIVTRKVDIIDSDGTGTRHVKDSITAAVRHNFVDVNICIISAVKAV